MSKKIKKDLEDIEVILNVWNYRLENNHQSFGEIKPISYEELNARSKSFQRDNNVPKYFDLNHEYDSLTNLDIAYSIMTGACSSTVPILTSGFFNEIHDRLSTSNGMLGKIFNHQGEWIDSVVREDGRRVVKGTFHRFRPDGMHDLLNWSGLSESIQQFGVLAGTLKYILHIVLDSCSKTGIPVPGTSNFLYLIREKFGMKLYSLEDQSRWAGLRMEDILQAGVTSGLLIVYNKLFKVPEDSLRKQQMAIISHGISLLGSSYIAIQMSDVRLLSKVSYPSAAMFIKNIIQMQSRLSEFSSNIEKLDLEIDKLINEEITSL